MCVPSIVHFFFPVSDSRQETIIVQADLPMELAVKVFFNVFPPVATLVSAGLFVLTGHPVFLISSLVFGIWTMASCCPSCFEPVPAPRRRARDIHDTYSGVLHHPPRHTTVEIHHHNTHQERPIYTQDRRNTGIYAPLNSLDLAHTQPYPSFTAFPPLVNPHERASVGRQSQPVTQTLFAPSPSSHERASVGRQAQQTTTQRFFAPPPANPTERAPVGRHAQVATPMAPRTDPTERAPVGRRRQQNQNDIS